MTLLRTFLADMPEAEAIDFLLKQMARSKNNREFFVQMARGVSLVRMMPADRGRWLAVDWGERASASRSATRAA